MRITNVQTNSFSLRVQEAPNANGSSPGLAVSYLMLEAGTWQLPDGRLLQVGRSTTGRTVGNWAPSLATLPHTRVKENHRVAATAPAPGSLSTSGLFVL